MAKILVVDDEPNMRLIIKEIMERDGYEVTEACDGNEALSALENHGNDIDLVITDLVMPKKNGLDLIMEITTKHPTLKILAMSGGGGLNGRFDYMPIAELVGAKAILAKPFKMDDLKAAITDILQ